MSLERELLKRVIKNQYINDSDNKNLRDEIQELLAQPEQSEQTEQIGFDSLLAQSQNINDKFAKKIKEYREEWSTHKPERMTDEEISAAIADHDPTPGGAWMFMLGIRWYEKYKARVGVYDDE